MRVDVNEPDRATKGSIRVVGWIERIMLEALRISRGPCRAPGLLVTAPSYGTPTIAISTVERSLTSGVRMNVGISM